jgi:hypothetical protein
MTVRRGASVVQAFSLRIAAWKGCTTMRFEPDIKLNKT